MASEVEFEKGWLKKTLDRATASVYKKEIGTLEEEIINRRKVIKNLQREIFERKKQQLFMYEWLLNHDKRKNSG